METLLAKIVDEIHRIQTKPWVIMEVCGGQTHSIVKHGIDYLLPEDVELVHGPGCPVCVTPLEMIDKAHAIARRPEVIFCSFGDMLRVPGSDGDLFTIKAGGGDVRVVYSPLDCLKIARANPDKKVVFFRHRVRNDRTRQCNAGLACPEGGIKECLDSGFTCSGSSVNRGDSAISTESRPGLFRAGTRLRHHGLSRIRADERALQGPYRHYRL